MLGGVVWMAAVQSLADSRSIRLGWTVVGAALIAIVVGVMLSVRTLTPATVQRPASFAIGDDVPTSFGIVAVEFIRTVDGVSHRALSGSTHGVSGYVEAGKQVAVALTNRGSQPLSYQVRQFELRATVAGKATIVPATAGDLPDGRILPDAGIEGHLDFTLPAAKAGLVLIFHDFGAAAPILIDLGTIGAPAPAPGHSHG
jgi:hypothetical protein